MARIVTPALGVSILAPSVFLVTVLATAVHAQDGLADADSAIEEIVVTGSRIKRRDFTSPSPITTIDRNTLAFSGQPTLEETLNQMPQVMPDLGRTANIPGDGTSRLNLRGLGAGRTLVLLNGRRIAPSGIGTAVDVNNLPEALIDRVELITGGASTVYGSDAVSGVVNFITRDDFDGVSIDAGFYTTEKGDAQIADLSVAFGHSLASGRGNITLFANVLDRDPLFAGEREFTSIAWQDTWEGEVVARGSPAIPETAIAQPVDLGNGEPVFALFESNGSLREFIDPDDFYNFAPINYLQLPLTRLSVGVMAGIELNDGLESYIELSHANNESRLNLAEVPAFGNVDVNLDNPAFPSATSQILCDNFLSGVCDTNVVNFPVARRMSEVGPRIEEHDRRYTRLVAGLRGDVGDDWDFDAWISYTDASEDELFLNDVSASRLAQGLLVDPATNQCYDPSNGCVPVNIFGAGNISAEAVEFIRIDNIVNTTERTQKLAAIVFTGPLYRTWAGAIDTAFGVEWRRDEGHFQADDALFLGDALGFRGASAVNGSENVWEAYGEAVIPLAEDLAWADYLGLEVGARYSEYDHAGGDWTYKVGGEWQPFEGLRLRGMRQRSVRAPNIAELFEEQFIETFSFVGSNSTFDPCSASADPLGNGYMEKCVIQGLDASRVGVFEATVAYPTDYVNGGNPDLTPETAETWTLGAVLTLDALPNWNISIDYFDIEVTDTIGSIDPALICFDSQNTEHLFCDDITRDATGNVSRIVQLTANRGLLHTSGIDTQIQYQRDLPESLGIGDSYAQITINTIWTRMLENDMQENPVTTVYECAGYFGWPCFDGEVFTGGQTFSENRITANANYRSGPLSVHLTWRWIQGTDNAAPFASAFFGYPDPDLGVPDVNDRSYFDLGLGYEFNEHVLARLNINNLLDQRPPLMASAVFGFNSDHGMYDIFGRSYYFSLSLNF
jgi:iron complex outermembrane receptor protein